MNPIRRIAAAALFVVATAATSVAADPWFHVTVQEAGSEGATVRLNLPMSMVEQALSMIQTDQYSDGQIVLNDQDFEPAKLRAILTSLRDAPEATFAEIEADGEKIVVYKEGRYLRIETGEGGRGETEINATLPLAVVDALLSGPEDTLDLRAAVIALARYGEGDLLTVRDGDDNIRIWVDDQPEGR